MRPDHHDHHVWPCFVVEGKSRDATTQPQVTHTALKPVKNTTGVVQNLYIY